MSDPTYSELHVQFEVRHKALEEALDGPLPEFLNRARALDCTMREMAALLTPPPNIAYSVAEL